VRTYEEIQASNLSFLKYLQSPVTPDNLIHNDCDYSVGKTSTLDRKISITSNVSLLCESKENINYEEQVENVEIRSSGNISWDTYLAYFMDGRKKSKLVYLIFTCILCQIVASSGDLWISYW